MCIDQFKVHCCSVIQAYCYFLALWLRNCEGKKSYWSAKRLKGWQTRAILVNRFTWLTGHRYLFILLKLKSNTAAMWDSGHKVSIRVPLGTRIFNSLLFVWGSGRHFVTTTQQVSNLTLPAFLTPGRFMAARMVETLSSGWPIFFCTLALIKWYRGWFLTWNKSRLLEHTTHKY